MKELEEIRDLVRKASKVLAMKTEVGIESSPGVPELLNIDGEVYVVQESGMTYGVVTVRKIEGKFLTIHVGSAVDVFTTAKLAIITLAGKRIEDELGRPHILTQ